jgi:hypothetical protein
MIAPSLFLRSNLRMTDRSIEASSLFSFDWALKYCEQRACQRNDYRKVRKDGLLMAEMD